jgi:predicted MPP superfamily phosphohydrolase
MLSGRLRSLWFLVSALPAAVAVAFVAVASFLAYMAWQPMAPASHLGLSAALALLVFGCIDWALLAGLPRLGLSFGPVGLPLFLITLVRLLAVLIPAWALPWTQAAWGWPAFDHLSAVGTLTVWLTNVGIVVCEVYGLYFEPFDVRVTHLELNVPQGSPGGLVRIVQLSDLHVERTTKREREVLRKVEALEPDIIVLTGDYLNGSYLEDTKAREDARWFLSRLSAPSGVYAVTAKRGDTLEAVDDIFGGVNIRVLRDEACRLCVSGHDLWLIGVSYLGRRRDAQVFSAVMRDVPHAPYSILLYHTTDLAGIASRNGMDLYLTGHTHGGQIRLPVFGAVFTNISSWKKYEQGLYRIGETAMYVNRGLGMEGKGGPRARFLCPPEILAVDLRFDQSD